MAEGRRRTDPGTREIELLALVVDDDPDSCAYVGTLLRRIGIRSVTETDSASAAELCDRQAFDLAIVDLRMSPLDGLELVSRIRRGHWAADMYCILLTAHDEPATRIEALRAGFDDVISKSVEEAELKAKLLASRRIVARQRKLDLALTELRSLANQDPLTGLFNRRFLFEELERTLARGHAVSLVLFDLDDFKIINDTYGHLTGDRVLRDVAAVLMRETRQQDLLARYGGDEFLLILEGAAAEEAAAVARRVADQIRLLSWTADAATFGLSMTFGVACSSLMEDARAEALLEACDRDLYKGKFLRRSPEAAFDYRYTPKGDARIHPIRLTSVLTRRLRSGRI